MIFECFICRRSYQLEKLCAEKHEGKTHAELLHYIAKDGHEDDLDYTCMCCCLSLKVSYYFLQMIWEKNTGSILLPDKLEALKIVNGVQKSCYPLSTPDGPSDTCRLCHSSCASGAACLAGVEQQPVLTWLGKHIEIDAIIKVCGRCSKALQVFQTLITNVRRSENLSLHGRAQNIRDQTELNEVDGKEVDMNSDSKLEDVFKQASCDSSSTHFQTEEISAYTKIIEHPMEELPGEKIREYTELGQEHRMEEQLEEIVEMPVTLYDGPGFKCSQCQRQFPSQKSLRIHITTKHGVVSGCKQQSRGSFHCDNCGKRYDFKCQLGSHQRFCTKRKSVPCNFCTETFVNVAMFERHIRTNHNIEVTHQCEVCSARFRTAVRLARHRLRHSQRYAQCDFCPQNYINQAELRKHVETKHGVGKKFACQYCPEHFRNAQMRRVHEAQQHAQYVFFDCRYCDFISTSSSSARQHQFKHTGNPYSCKICDRTFHTRSCLRQHASCQHGVQITDEECSEQFQQKFGRISRHDAFSAALNNLEIEDIDEELIETDLQREYNTSLDRIADYLFKECED